MALLTPLITLLQTNPILALLLGLTTILTIRSIYRLTLHPLAQFPGPTLAKLTSLWLHYHTYIGTEASTIDALHRSCSSSPSSSSSIQNPIIRIAPNQLSLSSPDSIQTIYVTGGGYPKSPFYSNFAIDGHATIFSAVDAGYRNLRAKAVAPLFSTAALRANAGKLQECVDAFVGRLQCAAAESRKGKGIVNLLTLTRGLAIDVVSTHLFERTYGANREGVGAELSVGAFVDVFVGVGRFFYLPPVVFRWVEWGVGKLFGQEKTALSMGVVDRFVESVVAGVEGKGEEESFPGRLLAAGIGREEVKAQCKDLVFAGTDSTGMNLATALRQLTLHPTITAKLSTELSTNASLPTPQDIQSLPYLTGVIKETLRLSMANPTRLPHRIPAGQSLLINGFQIPSGTDVGVSAYTLHLDPETFPEPWEFRPERWIETEGRKEQREKMGKAWFAFGAGSRMCIARNLATVELYMAVSRVVESGVLKGAKVAEEEVVIWEWFNSRVVGEEIGIFWEGDEVDGDGEKV